MSVAVPDSPRSATWTPSRSKAWAKSLTKVSAAGFGARPPVVSVAPAWAPRMPPMRPPPPSPEAGAPPLVAALAGARR
ncbi:hypothetical protein PUR29_18460 [Methylobacterium ajmalii]|uniref:Uncharacterized protein n=1 Tax=Methylobacterium ajmalii TaxID=2738439 RepID=A0ABU9ZXC5_9HYPH